jgi:hypothetical protein
MKGFIYALINPSLVGLVKVGRTDRDPDARAQELSGHTGIPTPFVVAYQRFVSDSKHAEGWVHTVLERRGYRFSERREFFKAPLHEVVEAMHSYRDEPPPTPANRASPVSPAPIDTKTGDEFLDSPTVEAHPPWLELLIEANAYYYGDGEQLQDHSEAFGLYEQAAQLGSAEAYRRLGEMCHAGQGVSRSFERALTYYKRAAAMGDCVAYACMAGLFKQEGHKQNEEKCWRKFVDTLAAQVEKGESPDRMAFTYAAFFLEESLCTSGEHGEPLFRTPSGEIYGESLFRKLSAPILEAAQRGRECLLRPCDDDRATRLLSVDVVIEWLRRRAPSL